VSLPKGVLPPSPSFAFPTLELDLGVLQRIHRRCVVSGNQYGFGSKVDISDSSDEVAGEDVDCSGYVRWLLYRATGNKFDIKDGSWIQHDYIKDLGFKQSTIQAANLKDGALRIAFLAPKALGPKAAGHVALILNDRTMESHSGTGPDSRDWDTDKRWMSLCRVYVLTAPTVVEK
jgi:hypothetical protein